MAAWKVEEETQDVENLNVRKPELPASISGGGGGGGGGGRRRQQKPSWTEERTAAGRRTTLFSPSKISITESTSRRHTTVGYWLYNGSPDNKLTVTNMARQHSADHQHFPRQMTTSTNTFSFDYEIADEDEMDPAEEAERNFSIRRRAVFRRPSDKYSPARPWPCRPCGLILGVCHILLGLCVIAFDVATNWITETVFAVTAGICFINSGVVGFIAARKLDKGSMALFVIFSLLSFGLCLILIIECASVLNQICTERTSAAAAAMAAVAATKLSNGNAAASSEMTNGHQLADVDCVGSVQAQVRAGLLVLALLEFTVDVISVFVGAKSLCGRYVPDMQMPSSPYHALIYGDLVPPAYPKRIVQLDSGVDQTPGSQRLLLEYLVLPTSSSAESIAARA